MVIHMDNELGQKNKLKQATKGNKGLCSRSSAFVHSFWVILTSLLVIGVCIDINISLVWPIAWFSTGVSMIFVCMYLPLKSIKIVLLVDFILSVSVVSLILLGEHSAPWHIYIVEVAIVSGQAFYALYLAETANRQILEKERLEILS